MPLVGPGGSARWLTGAGSCLPVSHPVAQAVAPVAWIVNFGKPVVACWRLAATRKKREGPRDVDQGEERSKGEAIADKRTSALSLCMQHDAARSPSTFEL